MGEYAKYNGQQIKIGTCESMYYLRADQAHLVQAMSGNVNPITDCESIRFRFPFPEEDGCKPGSFDDFQKTVGLYGLPVETSFEHHTTQFVSQRGYLTSLPCPETVIQDAAIKNLRFARNANNGPMRIVQQKVFNGMLVTVLECGGCGIAWRLETLEMAQPVIDLLRKYTPDTEINKHDLKRYREIANRIEQGYLNPPQWVKDTKREAIEA